ncbi:MAG: 3'(2'),5'-bisphosphate nucleotidase CysQ [Flavobacteriales bacterium]|nr:3'(2'),5'-bisphosphate nucleotidase CysQ [Flavobacteriales bacterium]
MDREDWLIQIINAALKGGKEILEVYNSDFSVETKDDNSPLTEADKRAHIAIMEALKATGIPVLSEEGKQMNYTERKSWKQFWMVDPLDGTKEFVKRNGEFTVNIALIEDGKATMGVIYVPVTKDLYFADKLAYKIEGFTEPTISIHKLLGRANQLPLTQTRNNYIVVGSRSHMSKETEAFIREQKKNHSEVDVLSKGSSLKLCMVAEGAADAYPRFAPTMEWDTAAGQAIAIASGAKVINWDTKQAMKYNKENLLNPWFLVER